MFGGWALVLTLIHGDFFLMCGFSRRAGGKRFSGNPFAGASRKPPGKAEIDKMMESKTLGGTQATRKGKSGFFAEFRSSLARKTSQ